ncbi:alpha/beta fold hydrolase [Amycolatopsis anabasis]|uniref:alpha/beta fold hydrolase n=1 Tax=Amycolatopsis anabasis TaxID=1840409 RepID=UPI00131B64D9|nr:alpha/beta hydrolase [Amycolatopsis anabasis]
MATELSVRHGGEGDPILLLLHGLGATGEVWRGLEARLPELWPGSWLVPDLPGHGRSAPAREYSFGTLAAELAGLVPPGRPVAVLGHSLGGVLALTLASGWFGVAVVGACGLGIKVRWTADDLSKAAAVAARPAKVLPTRDEAAERWLRMSGLAGLWTPEVVDAGIAETGGGWRVTVDQRAFGVGAPDLPGLLAAARAEVLLAAGENDPMCPAEHLRSLRVDPVILPALGHNAHVESPAALAPLLRRLHAPAAAHA